MKTEATVGTRESKKCEHEIEKRIFGLKYMGGPCYGGYCNKNKQFLTGGTCDKCPDFKEAKA